MSRVISVFLAAILVAAAPAERKLAPAKLALIVAIGDYPASSGYSSISSANDIPLVAGALQTQGFAASDITILSNSAATKARIVSAFQQLTARAKAGDAVVFHYSGHGHRVTDDNGDELDGLDEILVPYDAFIPEDELDKRPPHFLRDDELGKLLNALRAKVGSTGSVTVFLDACYSGSATRAGPGEPKVRGVMKPIILKSDFKAPGGSDDGAGVDADAMTRGGGAGTGSMVVISAARHDQVDNETYDANRKPVGPLSLAISMVLPRLSTWATNRTLHDKIAVAMSGMNLYDQRPQIEGAADARVFSGNLVEQKPYYHVDFALGDTLVRVNGGLLLGLTPGTKIDFHPVGTADPSKSTPITRGSVIYADAYNAVALLPRKVPAALESWAFVTEYAFDGVKTFVRINPLLSASAKELATRAVSSIKAVRIVNEMGDLLIRDPEGKGVVVEVAKLGGVAIGPRISLSSPSAEREIRDQVLKFSRTMMLRALDLKDPNYDVKLELVRTQPRITDIGGQKACAATKPVPIPERKATSSGFVLDPGDEYTLTMTNEGLRAAYVTILDLTPDGRITQLFPLPGNLGSDNYLEPGASFTIPDICFYAEPPAGIEVLKLFATRDRLDFTPVLAANATRGELTSPLAQLFADIYTGDRSAPVASSGTGSTSAISIIVRDKPRQ